MVLGFFWLRALGTGRRGAGARKPRGRAWTRQTNAQPHAKKLLLPLWVPRNTKGYVTANLCASTAQGTKANFAAGIALMGSSGMASSSPHIGWEVFATTILWSAAGAQT